jgi:hypothetical protein
LPEWTISVPPFATSSVAGRDFIAADYPDAISRAPPELMVKPLASGT